MKAAMAAAAALLIAAPAASAAEWAVDSAKSKLGFIGKQGGAPFEGAFKRWTAKIDFDPANPAAGKAVVEIDMTSAVTGDPQKDSALPESDWFNVKAFPQARFEATSFRSKGANAFEAVGALSIRGVKKDVVLPFTLDLSGANALAKGRLELVRVDYGIGQGVWKVGDTVALDVAVTLEVAASRKP